MNILERTIDFALVAHQGQTDKLGAPYILHPLRVGCAGKTISEQKVGFLHDVLEDTKLYMADIQFECELNQEEINALLCLRHEKNEPYLDYLEDVKRDPLALAVKKLDLLDNQDRTARFAAELGFETYARLAKKYADGYASLFQGYSADDVRRQYIRIDESCYRRQLEINNENP